MRTSEHRSWVAPTLLAAAGIASFLPAVAEAGGRRGRGLCATAPIEQHAAAPYLAVLSAFPAELAPLVAAAEIETTVAAGGRQYYLGRLDGVSVVLGLMGIGIVNATNTARDVLANFEVAGLVVSGVAGSHHRIGDVVLAADWVERDRKRVFHPNPALLALASSAQTALPAPLEKCTPVPPTSVDASIVCLPYDPAIIFGGRGVSGDDFGDALPCSPHGGEIFGCELPLPIRAGTTVGAVELAETRPDLEDMETAAAARAAARRGVPFIAVRAVSDGAGDPLGDRGFVAQFFDYYRLAARNAAVVTRAFVAELGALARDPSERRTCRLLAQRRWRRAAMRIRARQTHVLPPA
jgi:nucleoside phosphorylase